MVGVIDKNLKPKDPDIYLCRPSRERIAFLKEAKDISVNYKYNELHEISFSLPYKVRKNNKTVHNEHVNLIRGRYLLEVDGEYYIIDKFEKQAESKREIMNIHAYYLPYELRDKDVRAYKGVKKISEAMADTLLVQTNWKIDTISGELATQYRSYDVTESTLLDFVFETATMFKAVLLWDSKNKTVSFYKQENLGNDKGLLISDRKYLKEIMESVDFDSVCTRLKCFGKDGLVFNDISPIGANYLENFSAFMYPYEETITDELNDIYTVDSHSNFMSDELCHAILKYNKFINFNATTFQNLLDQKDTLNTSLVTLENQMTTLQTEYSQILDSLDVANANGQPTSDILIQKSNKETQISSKQDEIDNVESNITANLNSITALYNSLKIESHFTPELIEERNYYIIVRTFSNNAYIDSQSLYNAGEEALNNMIYPPINISLNIVNFLKVVKCQKDWDKLSIGNIINLSYPNFGIHIKAKILSIQIDYENNSIDLEIGNYKRLLEDADYFREMFYKSTSTSTQVDMNKMWWDSAQTNETAVGQLLNNVWDANKRMITAGTNNTVEIGQRGIIIKDPEDPLSYVIMKNNIIGITNDGGNSWKNCLVKSGLVAEHIVGNMIVSQDLTIGTENGDFLVNSQGVQISGLALTITDGGIKDSDIASSATWNSLAENYNSFVSQTYTSDLSGIQSQIDGKIETFFQTTDPNTWSIADRSKHNGDMWYNSSTHLLKRYNSTNNTWDTIEDQKAIDAYANASKAQDTADGKRRVFTAQPVPPYDIGDLWAGGSSVPLRKCKAAKISGQTYLASDWELADNSVQLGQLYNNLKFDSATGITATRSDNKVQTTMNATNGFKIAKGTGSGTFPDTIFSVDTDGEGLFRGKFNIIGSLKINGAEVLTENNKIKGDFIDKLKVNQLLIGGENGTISFNDLSDPPTAETIGAKPYDWFPSYGDITGTKPPSNADNTIGVIGANRLTYIDGNGIYTGTLTAQQINAIQGITLGANATIQWASLPSLPTATQIGARPNTWMPTASDVGALPNTTVIPVIPSYIKSTYIDSTTVQSPTIVGGTVTGGVLKTIDGSAKRIVIDTHGVISYDGEYQNGFYAVAGTYSEGAMGINHNGVPVIQFYWNGQGEGFFGCEGNLKIQAGEGSYKTYFAGNVDFNLATVTGLPSVIAKFG